MNTAGKDKARPLVSVIIPVYNTEKYLKRCVDSVLAQGFPEIEIILVDNASEDGCPGICDAYGASRENVKVIRLSKNIAPSGGRNAGLEAASGKYVYFLDSDDYIAEHAIERLAALAEKEDTDIVLFDAEVVDENDAPLADGITNKGYYVRDHEYPGVVPGLDMLRNMINNRDYTCVVQQLFIKRAFLVHNALSFHRIAHEDELFTAQALIRAKRTAHIPDRLFFRRWRPGSAMVTKPNSPGNARGCCLAARGIIDDCDKLLYPAFYPELLGLALSLAGSALRIYAHLEPDEKDTVSRDIESVFTRMGESAFIGGRWALGKGMREDYRSAERVIFYGGGKKCAEITSMLAKAGARLPDEIWDMSAPKIGPVMGINTAKPDFETAPAPGTCVTVILLVNFNAYEAVKKRLKDTGFDNIRHWLELYDVVY